MLRAEAVVVAGGEGYVALATVDEGSDFGFVGGAEAVDEFGVSGAAETAGEDATGEGFGGTAAAVDFDQSLVGTLFEMADTDLALVPIDDGFDAIAGDVIAGDLDLSGEIVAEPEEEQSVVEIFDGGGEGVAVKARAESEGAGGHLAGEPKDFVDVVDGHVGKDAVALIAIRGGGGVFEGGIDFEDTTDEAGVQALLAVGDGGIETALEGEHEGVRRVAVKFGAEGGVTVEGAGEGLFENDAMAGADDGRGLLAMLFGGGDDHGGGRDAGGEVGVERGENRCGAAGFGDEALDLGGVDVDEGGEAADAVLAFEFEEVAGVDGAHTAEADDTDFEGGRHRQLGEAKSSLSGPEWSLVLKGVFWQTGFTGRPGQWPFPDCKLESFDDETQSGLAIDFDGWRV